MSSRDTAGTSGSRLSGSLIRPNALRTASITASRAAERPPALAGSPAPFIPAAEFRGEARSACLRKSTCALALCQPAVVEHLQETLKHIRFLRLFDLMNRVPGMMAGAVPPRAASRPCQSRHIPGVPHSNRGTEWLLMYSDMSMRHPMRSRPSDRIGQGPASVRSLSDTRRPRNRNEPERRFWVLQPSSGARIARSTLRRSLPVLADHRGGQICCSIGGASHARRQHLVRSYIPVQRIRLRQCAPVKKKKPAFLLEHSARPGCSRPP